MDKLWLIIKREYLTRVKKRSFIITTVITPLALVLFMVVVGFIFSYESGDVIRIAVVDEGNILNKKKIKNDESLYFYYEDQPIETLRDNFDATVYSGILAIPPLQNIKTKKHTIYYYSDRQPSIDVSLKIEQRVSELIREHKIDRLQLDKEGLKALNTKIVLDPEPITPNSEDTSNLTTFIAAGIGGVMGMIMYMTVFIYGMMVMRSVMEEKMNRIVEIMISSVRPFQLMMGKIIGVGAVGLTQVGIWALLMPILYFLVILFFGFNPDDLNSTANMPAEIDMADMEVLMGQITNELTAINWWLIIPLFIFYFLGGYFLYASLFAAVGSAMGDDLGEGQALTIPITIPVVMAFYIMFVAVRAPQSSLAVWSSIFPLFSPIVMPARLAFDPPFWQIATSVLVLLISALFFVWLSARIYRVGILMYGKKVSFRELGKWLFYKD